MRTRLLLAILIAGGCRSSLMGPEFIQIISLDDGRVYFANDHKALRTRTGLKEGEGGFIMFKDAVTHERVKLLHGTYIDRPCPPELLNQRQQEYIHNPQGALYISPEALEQARKEAAEG